MFLLKRYKVRSYEMGLYFRDGEFRGLLEKGTHWFIDPLGKVRVDVVSRRDPWLVHEKLDLIVKSGALAGAAVVLDLKDYERALVWIDGRFSHVLPPGLYAYWTGQRKVRRRGASTPGRCASSTTRSEVIVRSATARAAAGCLHGRAATA